MTDRPDIDAIERRAEAATEGPWKAGRRDMLLSILGDPKLFKQVYAEAVREEVGDDYQDIDDLPMMLCRTYGREKDEIHDNAAFIAHARTDIPALIAYIRYLESKL